MSDAIFFSKFIEDTQKRLNFNFNRPDFERIIKIIESSSYSSLKDLVERPVKSGSTPDKLKDKKKEVTLLRIKNITRDNKINYESEDFVSRDYVLKIEKNEKNGMLLQKGDIIIAITGATIGKIAIFNEDKEVAICADIAKIRLKGISKNELVINFINSDYGKAQIKKLINGSTNFHLSCSDIEDMVIPIPKEINKVIKVNNALENIKNNFKFNLKDLDFINRRILVTSKLELPKKHSQDYFLVYPNSELIKKRLEFKWFNYFHNKIVKLIQNKDYFRFADVIEEDKTKYGLTASGKEHGRYPFINIENLKTDGSIDISNTRYIKEDEIDENTELFVKENDILISRSRLVGVASVVDKKQEELKCLYGSYIIKFRIKDTKEINPRYVALFINSILGQAQTELLKSGSSGYNINSGQLKEIKILRIKPTLQEEIVNEVKLRTQLAETLKNNYNLLNKIKKKAFIKMSLNKQEPSFYDSFIKDLKELVEKKELGSITDLQAINKKILEIEKQVLN
jgi:type I restriction enzyme S subunit